MSKTNKTATAAAETVLPVETPAANEVATPVHAAEAPKKRGRKFLDDASKVVMADARRAAIANRDEIATLATNPKVTDPKSWNNIPFEQVEKIHATLVTNLSERKQAQIEALRAKIEALGALNATIPVQQ